MKLICLLEFQYQRGILKEEEYAKDLEEAGRKIHANDDSPEHSPYPKIKSALEHVRLIK